MGMSLYGPSNLWRLVYAIAGFAPCAMSSLRISGSASELHATSNGVLLYSSVALTSAFASMRSLIFCSVFSL